MLVRLAIVLRYRNQSSLDAFVRAQNDPRSALAGRYLSRAQFLSAYAPAPAQYAFVANDLRARGFRIVQAYENRTVLDVEGSALAVERAFATRLDRVVAGGRTGYANVAPATLPPELAGVVSGVLGFDDVGRLRTANLRGAPRAVDATRPLFGPDTGFGPAAFAGAYDLPVRHGIDGAGQTAAIVIDADFADADVAQFLRYFGVSRGGGAIARIPVDGGPDPAMNPDSVETTLDVEAIASLAPGAAIEVYETSSLLYATTLDAYNRVVSDDSAGVVNSSFGGCETQTSPRDFPQLANQIAEQGAALGIAFVASTGDAGTFACRYPGPGGVETPASSPYFVAVGGTTLILRRGAAYALELGWGDSGGGFSALFARPAYQNGVKGLVGSTRNLPDVAFDADPGSGMAFYYGGRWDGPIGGTSLASPIFAALCTQLAQHAGHRIGANLHGAMYRAFAARGYGPAGAPLFRDVTFGNDGYFNAHAGYDQVTGIGSIEGWNLARIPAFVKPAASVRSSPVQEFAVTLALRDRAGLTALISSQADPRSPLYHHFLSPAQFRAAFAPSAAAYARAIAALERGGFAIEQTSPSRTLIDVRGAADAAERAAAISGVSAVLATGGAVATTPTAGAARAAVLPYAVRGYGPDGGFGPAAITLASDFPVAHGVTGAGVTVADVVDGRPREADLHAFDRYFGIARAQRGVAVVKVDGGKGADVVQADADSEWIGAAAPGAAQLFYEVPELSAKDTLDAYTRLVTDDRADVVNTSWGGCDSSLVTLALALQPVFAQGAAEGIAFEGIEFGSPCGGWLEPLPMAPGDTADGLAVGGSYVSESAGSRIVAQSALIGSNGGVSILAAEPLEQKKIAGTSALGRNAPDLVLPATVNGAGSSFYAGGAWIGGFSFVNNAPAAGLLATFEQMHRSRLGAFDLTLYRLFASSGYGGAFVDVTTGCSGTFGGAAICAKQGYDLSTGIGSVGAYALAKLL